MARPKNLEKMDVEKNTEVVEEVKVEETKAEEKKPTKGAKGTRWIADNALFTKTCEACGATMLGWAYREPFQYCPKCGAMAEKAI